MHFNFHLSGDESPEQTRRIANAVLALGGATLQIQDSDLNLGEELLTDEERAKRRAKYEEFGGPVTIGERAPIMGKRSEATQVAECAARDEYLNGIMDRSEALLAELPPTPATIGEWVGGQVPDPAKSIELPIDRATLDKNGLPWDERIHSSSRAINADGTWRYRKNVPDETKQSVEAELRGLVDGAGRTAELMTNVAEHVLAAPPVPVPPIPTADRAAYNESLNEAAAHGQLPPPVPVSLVQRSYSDVVNLIMANQATLNKPELYVAVLGMSLPEFAAACIAKPELATMAFNALDEIRRS